MSTSHIKNVLRLGFPSFESDYPDGIHPDYGFMNVNASLARLLNDPSPEAQAEECERIKQRIAANELNQSLGFAGMDAERVHSLRVALELVRNAGRRA